MATRGSIETNRRIGSGALLRTLLLAMLLQSVASVSVASDFRPEDGLPVRPANAETVFDHVLVFPADADDQAIESWRRRAFDRVQASCIDPAGCVVRMVRFHVAARWQLPMVGMDVEGQTRPLNVAVATDGPVWLANTSIQSVRAQIASIVGR